MNKYEEKFKKRFWSKVKKTKTCWLWIGSTQGNPYGGIFYKGKGFRINRAAWYIATGKILPKPIHVLHKCDVPRCVRKSHLFVGNQKINSIDAFRKGRKIPPTIIKLNYQKANFIRKYYDSGNYNLTELAKKYEVSAATISRVVKHKTWSKNDKINTVQKRCVGKIPACFSQARD